MAYNMGGRRFRPVGSGKKRTAPQYGPVGTGCPFVEEAVARLYREQNEEHFWSLMNALNYALELQTKVLVPLDAAVDPQSGAAPWAHLPIPEERAEGLPPWLLHARKERHYLPLFTSVKNAEAEKASATRPMVERSLRSAMEYALETDGIDGVVLDPWTSSATLDVSLLSGLLRSERGSDNPGAQELEAGHAGADLVAHAAHHLRGRGGGRGQRPATLPPPRRAAQRRFLPWGTACIMAGVSGRIRPRPGGCGKRPRRPGRCRP